MRVNWKEIPDLISFCNSMNAFIFLNTVYFPSNLALWNLPSQELKEIHVYLKSLSISGSGVVAIKNKKHFNNFLDQIESWQLESIKREKDKEKWKTMDGNIIKEKIMQKLKAYILSDLANERLQEYHQLSEKFQQIFNNIKSNEIKNGVLITISNMPIEAVYETLKENTNETLTNMLNDYVEKQNINEANFIFKYDE